MRDVSGELVSAARIYYDYLEANHLGLSQIALNGYEVGDIELALHLRVGNADMDMRLGASLILQCEKEMYEVGEDRALELRFYDEKQKILYLGIDEGLNKVFKNAKKHKIPIILWSDLKFLVKNVEEFFKKHGQRVALPTSIPSVSLSLIQHDFKERDTAHRRLLSKEQAHALEMVLTSPLSYVWGPPGTGKTQAVLFEALLCYIKEGKKVCVVASTNHALEQVLSTLIKQFDLLGFERRNILRLGTPSLRFLKSFGEVCDPGIFAKKGELGLFNFQDTLKTRLKEALVVGVTLDGFISRYESLELKFSHIFLDECAFAPLIKACSLCVDNTPLGLFGDHKQLSPVCEMPQNELKKEQNLYANMWNFSSLYLEAFCTTSSALDSERDSSLDSEANPKATYDLESSPSEAFYTLSNAILPPLKYTHLSMLSKTHRYGDNLATILDSYIYHMGLKGNGAEMELYVLDSGAKPIEEDRHLSESEARLCEGLCVQLPLRFNCQDFALITPFVKQRNRLGRSISRDRIFTIHGSQGQEFESVIFSPVCFHYYLTNSQNPNALYALNVAISRIKKRLFIVCDVGFWRGQKNQLLSAIIAQSKLIRL